jgi:hypothetical protein
MAGQSAPSVSNFPRQQLLNPIDGMIGRVAHPLFQVLRAPHPFASFAKGWVFPPPQTGISEKGPVSSVRGIPPLHKAQGRGTRLIISGRSYFAEVRFAARSTAFSAAWGNWTGTKYSSG